MLARLERIEALERKGAGATSVLAELRELVREATEWAERERDPRAMQAAAALAEARDADEPPHLISRSRSPATLPRLRPAPIE